MRIDIIKNKRLEIVNKALKKRCSGMMLNWSETNWELCAKINNS